MANWVRQALPALTGVGIIGFSGFQLFINGPYVHQVAAGYARDSEGRKFDDKLDEDLQNLIDQVMRDLKLDEQKRKRLKFFRSNTVDVYNFGSTKFPWGCCIGLPDNVELKSEQDAMNQIKIYSAKTSALLNYEKPKVKRVVESYYLSDSAKKFLIAREILYAETYVALAKIITLPTLAVPFMAYLHYILNYFIKTPGGEGFFSNLGFFYFFFIAFMSINWVVIIAAFEESKKLQVDQLCADLGNEYLNGGIEFYEKDLIRDKSIRKMVDKENSFLYINKPRKTLIPKLELESSKRFLHLKKRLLPDSSNVEKNVKTE